MREAKDLDQIAELFLQVITIYGLKINEVVALNYYITERTIKAKHNAESLKEKLSLDVMNLSVSGLLKVQEALVNICVSELIYERRQKDGIQAKLSKRTDEIIRAKRRQN